MYTHKKIVLIVEFVSSFLIFISCFMCFCLLIHQLSEYEEFCESNKSYIVTVDDEVIYCQSIDFNQSYSFLFGSDNEESYITLQIDDNTYRNIPRCNEMTIETIYEVDEPSFIEFCLGADKYE